RPIGSSLKTKPILPRWPSPCAGAWRDHPPEKRSGSPTEETSSTGKHMARILLVEDNEMNRDMLSRRLIRNGYEVCLAVDGQQGADMALSEVPDLILMAMSLPVIDGWEAM